jgi:hypothetical protein
MGAGLLLALLFAVAFVIGGLLIRGRGSSRGVGWWLGLLLVGVGALGASALATGGTWWVLLLIGAYLAWIIAMDRGLRAYWRRESRPTEEPPASN